MLKKQIFGVLPILLLILTVWSIAHYIPFPTTNTFLRWLLSAWIIWLFLSFAQATRHLKLIDKTYRKCLNLYFIWIIVCSIRGVIMCIDINSYWIWKQLVQGILCLVVPLVCFVMCSPNVANKFLSVWLKYAIWVFLFLVFFIPIDSYNFYLAPLFLIGCFLPLAPKRWVIVIMVLLVTMIFIDLGARSQVIKAVVTIFMSLVLVFHHNAKSWIIKIVHWLFYIATIVLLFLGISGQYNILEELSEKNRGKLVETRIEDGKIVEDDVSADTRTFIYEEVIKSALKNNYVMWGRTPARGNDSRAFGDYSAEELQTGLYERHGNELAHTTVFTWTGLIGVVLYTLLYLRASWLAVYRSRNYYIKLLGCLVAFRWMYGWIEDTMGFNTLNISLWTMIAMCCSNLFREMSNREFEVWVKRLFV